MRLTEIGIEIGQARKLRKLTQRELARKAGVSLATVNLLEKGRAAEIGYSRLVRMLAAVGLELELRTAAARRPTLDDLLREDGGDGKDGDA